MKQQNRFLMPVMALMLLLALGVTSCKDDMASSNYYTYKADMLSDYFKNNSDFTKFGEIVDRAGRTDLFATYGTYTCFVPTNDAVDIYLSQNGYATVNDIPADLCDTLVRTAVMTNMYSVVDFAEKTGSGGITNMLNNWLSITDVPILNEDGDTVSTTYRINDSGAIILSLANDSVGNGIVHPVDRVIAASSGLLGDIIKKNPKVSLYATAIEACGLSDSLRRLKDPSWDPEPYRFQEKTYYSGSQDDYCHIPDERRFGATAFLVPDSVLAQKYNIKTLKDLYEKAVALYTDDATKKYATTEAGMADLENPQNPLHRLMAYHLLPFNTTLDMMTTLCTINDTYINPIEWYRTMDRHATLKMERLRQRVTYGVMDGLKDDRFINRNVGTYVKGTPLRGAKITADMSAKNIGYNTKADNGSYYYIDQIIAFDNETKNEVFNCRIRVDLYNLFPELYSNNIRNEITNENPEPASDDPNIAPKNFILPFGYLDDVENLNEDGIFFYQGARNYYWSYEGDEFNLCSDNDTYDITFRLPTVPSGTYEVRLGFCLMSTRGIGQLYLDGKPQGIPLDMRSNTGWQNRYMNGKWTTLESLDKDVEEQQQMKKTLRNNGWMYGPKGVFNFGGPARNATSPKDGSTTGSRNLFCNNLSSGGATVRRIVATNYQLDENKTHTMRIKCVWSVKNTVLMIDYLELVPKSVYGVDEDGEGEDDY